VKIIKRLLPDFYFIFYWALSLLSCFIITVNVSGAILQTSIDPITQFQNAETGKEYLIGVIMLFLIVVIYQQRLLQSEQSKSEKERDSSKVQYERIVEEKIMLVQEAQKSYREAQQDIINLERRHAEENKALFLDYMEKRQQADERLTQTIIDNGKFLAEEIKKIKNPNL
jgi:hypothetical protein